MKEIEGEGEKQGKEKRKREGGKRGKEKKEYVSGGERKFTLHSKMSNK